MLDDFERRPMTFLDQTRDVYVAGHGPAVVVMAEMPGISPDVARFARWIREAGFRVYMPSLFGRDGAYPEAEEGRAVLRQACISAEFGALRGASAAPVTRWLRALAATAHAECGGPGVGAIGMCFTGNFALGMLLAPATIAPVLCQPSLPFEDPTGLQLSAEEAAAIRERLEREDLSILGFRFEGDRHCTARRFAACTRAFGERFVGTVLPDAAANPAPPPFFAEVVGCPHSVVTAHLVDAAGEPTVAARDAIVAFLKARCKA